MSGFFKEMDEDDPMTIAFKEAGLEGHQWEVWQMGWNACLICNTTEPVAPTPFGDEYAAELQRLLDSKKPVWTWRVSGAENDIDPEKEPEIWQLTQQGR